MRERRFPTAIRRVQVHQECCNTLPTAFDVVGCCLTIGVEVIIVLTILLPHVIPQELDAFAVLNGQSGQVADTLLDDRDKVSLPTL